MNDKEESKPIFLHENQYIRIKEKHALTEFGSVDECV